jgi:hypothetical protein
MATKIQGILPVYDPARKMILGAYLLPMTKTFDGTETQHNINAPAATDATNTVPVQKISPNYQPINANRKESDWFMAAVFTDAQIRSGYYKQFKNFQFIADMAPDAEWVNAASHSMGQLRYSKGALITGLEGDFSTGVVNELAPRNTVAPAATGTATVGSTLSVTTGTWTAGGAITYTYQWLRAGIVIPSANAATYLLVAADSGKTISCTVTATYSGYPAGATSNGIAVA